MAVLRVNSVSKWFIDRKVLNNVSFEIAEGEVVALVGANGVGKTTLIRAIIGELPADEGSVILGEGITIGYLPQHFSLEDSRTLHEELSAVPGENPAIDEGLKRFGFKTQELNQTISTMSGGQKTRVALLKLWLRNPHFLIMDEPTNHLDTQGLDWIESFVRTFEGTVLVISHDRYFLDKVATRILELSAEGVASFDGNYTAYRNRKEEMRRAQLALYEEQERRARKLKQAISQQMEWFRMSHRDAGKDSDMRSGVKEFYRAKAAKIAKRAKCTIKRLERLEGERISKPKDDPTVKIKIDDAEKTGRRVITASGLTKVYDRCLFRNSDFIISRGDKIGLVGPNAAGKTTLLRLILGQERATTGELWLSPGIRIGYMDQELANLKIDRTVLEEAYSVIGQDIAAKDWARRLLGAFLFTGGDVHKPVGVLSIGERVRLSLVKLLLQDFNFLVLDEPTNHLDLPTREKLEEALESYDGTLILVSHDRYLLRRVCNKTLAIEGLSVRTYLGNYDYYLDEKRRRLEESKHGSAYLEKRNKKDEALLLANRLAVLSAKLNWVPKTDPEYAGYQDEFMDISRRLSSMKQ